MWVGARIDNTDDAWQMPQGGIDKGEEPWATALRELEEETGIAPHLVERVSRMPRALALRSARGVARQIMGRQVDRPGPGLVPVPLPRHATTTSTSPPQHPEFREWRWIEPAQLPELIVPFKRDLYRRLIAEFAEYL